MCSRSIMSPNTALCWLFGLCVFLFSQATFATQATSSLWIDSDLDKAIKLSKGKKPLIVNIHAEWCAPCNQLANEVLFTQAAKVLLKGAIGVRFDFETKKGRVFTTKYGIIGLPSTLVLSPTGKELGRIQGYPGRKEFLKTMKDVLAGRASLEVLAKQAKASPKDPAVQMKYAQALLFRGKIDQGRALLKPFMKGKDRYAAQAFRIWGRWLLRVQRKGKPAVTHFMNARMHFAGSPYESGFLYWAAKAYQELGQHKKALALFDEWAKKASKKVMPLMYKADFMVHYKYPTADIKTLLKVVMKKVPQSAWLHYLLAQVLHREGKRKEALEAIGVSLQRAPRRAIYINFARQLAGKGRDPSR